MKNSAALYSIVRAPVADAATRRTVSRTLMATIDHVGRNTILHTLILAIVVTVALIQVL